MDRTARWEKTVRRRTWSRHWRVPKATRISGCDYKGDPNPPVWGQRLGCHFPESPLPTPNKAGEDRMMQWRLQYQYRVVADLKYYADWYARYSAEERDHRYERFARKCYHQMRFRATADGRIPSRASLPFFMANAIQAQLDIQAQHVYGAAADVYRADTDVAELDDME